LNKAYRAELPPSEGVKDNFTPELVCAILLDSDGDPGYDLSNKSVRSRWEINLTFPNRP
jgi:hypothetical protein